MKKIIYSVLLAASFCACTKETINYQNPVPGENGSETNATLAIASRNTLFTAKDDVNASIAFKSLGGKVVLDVNTTKNGPTRLVETTSSKPKRMTNPAF